MSENLYVFTLVLIAATCVLIFGARAWVNFQSARTHETREKAYQDLAAKCAANESEAALQRTALQGELMRVATRLTAIEALLQSVE